jgi:hypothetical protein
VTAIVSLVACALIVGLPGWAIAGREFAGPYGGLVGLFLGIAVALWMTHQTPKSMRRRRFSMYLRGAGMGTRIRDDSRLVVSLGLAFLGSIGSITWQLVLE